MATSNRKGIIESLLFSADQPLSAERLVDLLELERRDVVAVIAELQEEYIARNGGIELQEVAGGFQFRTRKILHQRRPDLVSGDCVAYRTLRDIIHALLCDVEVNIRRHRLCHECFLVLLK